MPATSIISTFDETFGREGPHCAMNCLLRGSVTLGSKRLAQQLAAEGGIETLLSVLRDSGPNVACELLAPLRDHIVCEAVSRSWERDWLIRCKRFLTDTALIQEGSRFDFADHLALSRQYDLYDAALDSGVRSHLITAIDHVRTLDDVEGWLTTSGVQDALKHLFLVTMKDPEAAEEVLAGVIPKDICAKLLRKARTVGVERLSDLLDDEGELLDAIGPLIPTGPSLTNSPSLLENYAQGAYIAALNQALKRRKTTSSQPQTLAR